MSEYQEFIFASDIHGDMQDKGAVGALFEFCDRWKPDIKVIGGDLFDFRALRKGASEEERRDSMLKDVEMGMEFFDKFQPQYYIRGNHCFEKSTELLTIDGWKLVSDITPDDYVVQVDEHREVSYAKPVALHRNDFVDKLVEIKGAFTNQAVTHGHDVIVDGIKQKAGYLLGKKIKASSIWRAAIATPRRDSIEENWLRLLTWVVMDGTIVDYKKYQFNSRKIRVQFKLSKEHKIVRLRELLEDLGIPYTFAKVKKSGINKLQPYYVRIYGDHARAINEALGGRKVLPSWWSDLPGDNLNTFIRELSWTDGCVHDASVSWTTVERENVETVSLWCVRNGVEFTFRPKVNASGFDNARLQYGCSIRYRAASNDSQYLKIREIDYGDSVYCVTMPLGRVVSRRHGAVAVSGNCERVWQAAGKTNGVISDFCRQLANEIGDRVKASKCVMKPYDKREGIVRIGKLKMIHGFYAGVTAVRRTAQAYGSVIMGHGHAIDHATIEGIDRRMGRMAGCLCKLDMEYNATHVGALRHAHGWISGVVHRKTGVYHVFQHERIGKSWNHEVFFNL